MNSKVFIVTGASRGLGKAITHELSQLDCRITATASDMGALETLWHDNPNVYWTAADLTYPDQIQSIVTETLEQFGRIDGLINNAGTINPIQPLAGVEQKEWSTSIEVNLIAPAMLMATALPHLQKTRGKVINISSGAAVKSVQGWSAYCTAKAGLLHLTTVAAEENPEVTFFSLRPGVIDTDMQKEIRGSQGMTSEDLARFQELDQNGQLEPPSVPAKAAAWLALFGPHSRSGEFIEYTDEEIQAGVKTLKDRV